MENKNKTYIFSVVFFAVGLLLGGVVFQGDNDGNMDKDHQHMMVDGTMMHDDDHMDMADMMDGMMMGLEGKTGDEFDQAFLSEMIVHHEGAVEMAEAVLATSDRPELIKLAEDIITAQTGEISMMKGWLEEWY